LTIDAIQFRAVVIKPALVSLARAGIPSTLVAADLLMATAAVESHLGTFLDQIEGPARSVFQIQPDTLADALQHARSDQRMAISEFASSVPTPIIDQISGNLVLAAACARLIYWQVPDPLPPHTPAGLWAYYKAFWNTPLGRTTETQFMAALGLTDIAFAPLT